jgi:hypothetical protein
MIPEGQWRIIWKSPKLPASPWAAPAYLPEHWFQLMRYAVVPQVLPNLEDRFFEDIARFAATEKSFYLPRLCLAQIGRFLALVPKTPCPELNQMADRCVRHFDWYRRPASAVELNRRRAAGLSSRQEHYL